MPGTNKVAQHTPGPWKVVTQSAGMMSVYPKTGPSICAVGYCRENEPAIEANARLIAAAPELYDALRIALVQIGEYTDGDGAAKYHAINIARAALALAEGGAA